jgi:predicted amidohydrolase
MHIVRARTLHGCPVLFRVAAHPFRIGLDSQSIHEALTQAMSNLLLKDPTSHRVKRLAARAVPNQVPYLAHNLMDFDSIVQIATASSEIKLVSQLTFEQNTRYP